MGIIYIILINLRMLKPGSFKCKNSDVNLTFVILILLSAYVQLKSEEIEGFYYVRSSSLHKFTA